MHAVLSIASVGMTLGCCLYLFLPFTRITFPFLWITHPQISHGCLICKVLARALQGFIGNRQDVSPSEVPRTWIAKCQDPHSWLVPLFWVSEVGAEAQRPKTCMASNESLLIRTMP